MSTFTTRDGCPIEYREAGSGEQVLVLLHGWSQSQATFDHVVEPLAADRRVVTYDQRGHGRSGRPAGGARIATLAADLHDLLDHLGLERVDLLGHSMGASVLWSYLDTHGSNRVDRLVLLDQPSVCTRLPWMDAADAQAAGAILDMPGAEGFCRALLGEDSGAAREAFLRSMLSDDVPEDLVGWLLGENLAMDVDFGTRLLLDHVMQDWRDVLPRIDRPTLVVGGRSSHVDPASQEWIADRIPGSRLRVFGAEEGGSHFPFVEQPQTFVDELTGFLAR
ncbi:alpha/beta fold hydrolase [Phycicoccus avicenniae]|uniref:alpha/beta fold hydrolase n=1 Tax=Phycicoccus avicenniae TaxID=2828860 RepID=UPI003D2A0BA0